MGSESGGRKQEAVSKPLALIDKMERYVALRNMTMLMESYAQKQIVDALQSSQEVDERTRRVIKDQEAIIESTMRRLKETQAVLAIAKKLHAQASQLLAEAGKTGSVKGYNAAIQKLVELGKLLQGSPGDLLIRN